MFHMAWFGPGGGVQGWGTKWAGAIGKYWMLPDLYIDMCRALEGACFDYVIIEDSLMVADTFRGTMEYALVLLRHNPSLPRISQFCKTAWTSWQAFDDSADQPSVHCCNRVRDVPLRPQWRILWVGNGRVRQVAGAARWNMVLRGGSSPVRR